MDIKEEELKWLVDREVKVISEKYKAAPEFVMASLINTITYSMICLEENKSDFEKFVFELLMCFHMTQQAIQLSKTPKSYH